MSTTEHGLRQTLEERLKSLPTEKREKVEAGLRATLEACKADMISVLDSSIRKSPASESAGGVAFAAVESPAQDEKSKRLTEDILRIKNAISQLAYPNKLSVEVGITLNFGIAFATFNDPRDAKARSAWGSEMARVDLKINKYASLLSSSNPIIKLEHQPDSVEPSEYGGCIVKVEKKQLINLYLKELSKLGEDDPFVTQSRPIKTEIVEGLQVDTIFLTKLMTEIGIDPKDQELAKGLLQRIFTSLKDQSDLLQAHQEASVNFPFTQLSTGPGFDIDIVRREAEIIPKVVRLMETIFTHQNVGYQVRVAGVGLLQRVVLTPLKTEAADMTGAKTVDQGPGVTDNEEFQAPALRATSAEGIGASKNIDNGIIIDGVVLPPKVELMPAPTWMDAKEWPPQVKESVKKVAVALETVGKYFPQLQNRVHQELIRLQQLDPLQKTFIVVVKDLSLETPNISQIFADLDELLQPDSPLDIDVNPSMLSFAITHFPPTEAVIFPDRVLSAQPREDVKAAAVVIDEQTKAAERQEREAQAAELANKLANVKTLPELVQQLSKIAAEFQGPKRGSGLAQETLNNMMLSDFMKDLSRGDEARAFKNLGVADSMLKQLLDAPVYTIARKCLIDFRNNYQNAQTVRTASSPESAAAALVRLKEQGVASITVYRQAEGLTALNTVTDGIADLQIKLKYLMDKLTDMKTNASVTVINATPDVLYNVIYRSEKEIKDQQLQKAREIAQNRQEAQQYFSAINSAVNIDQLIFTMSQLARLGQNIGDFSAQEMFTRLTNLRDALESNDRSQVYNALGYDEKKNIVYGNTFTESNGLRQKVIEIVMPLARNMKKPGFFQWLGRR